MTIQSQQDIVELQVTVDDTILVEVLERQADFGGIESRTLVSAFPITVNKQGKSKTYCARLRPN